jgi:hypothetical protein
MQFVLSKHQSIFSTTQGLLPSRGTHDHSIPLIPSKIPPNVHPYRHPFAQKNKIEKIVQKLLVVGIIPLITSPYSSPFVMVLKKEGTWCMCLDFYALNRIIIKDKFPIPVIDDLLDELKGVQFFTKLDLLFRISPNLYEGVDFMKIYFFTHKGHYEFLVIPFDLFNAHPPSKVS